MFMRRSLGVVAGATGRGITVSSISNASPHVATLGALHGIPSLAQNKNLRSIVQSHLPRAEETLDNLGRMKLLFDLREGKIKSSIGNDTYTDMTQTLRDVFSQLGDLLLKLNQTSDQLLPAAIG